MSKKSQWEFYLQRRNCSLEGFLSDVKNLKDAKDLFSSRGVKPPIDEVILSILKDKDDARIEKEKQKTLPKKTVARRKRQPKKVSKSPKKTEDTLSSKEDAHGGKYFRKVIPAKKKS